MRTIRATERGNLAWFSDPCYRAHAQMKSGARRRRQFVAASRERSELFEITAIAHRHDDAFWRHDQPASVLSLDLFDRTEARQRRARNDLIDVPVSLHVNETIARIVDRPVGYDRQTRLHCSGGGFRPSSGKRPGWRGLRLRRHGAGDVCCFATEP